METRTRAGGRGGGFCGGCAGAGYHSTRCVRQGGEKGGLRGDGLVRQAAAAGTLAACVRELRGGLSRQSGVSVVPRG